MPWNKATKSDPLSHTYRCLKCGSRLQVLATYDSDEVLGDSIDLTITCRKCNESYLSKIPQSQIDPQIKGALDLIDDD